MDWIEKAELKERQRKLAKENVEQIKDKFIKVNDENLRNIIANMEYLSDRIHKLPIEERKPCRDIGYTELVDDNKFEFYGSSYFLNKTIKTYFTGRKNKVLYWRRIVFKIADEFNLVKITLTEETTPDKSKNSSNHKVIKQKNKFSIKISNLSPEQQQLFINWLTFRKKYKSLVAQLEAIAEK